MTQRNWDECRAYQTAIDMHSLFGTDPEETLKRLFHEAAARTVAAKETLADTVVSAVGGKLAPFSRYLELNK